MSSFDVQGEPHRDGNPDCCNLGKHIGCTAHEHGYVHRRADGTWYRCDGCDYGGDVPPREPEYPLPWRWGTDPREGRTGLLDANDRPLIKGDSYPWGVTVESPYVRAVTEAAGEWDRLGRELLAKIDRDTELELLLAGWQEAALALVARIDERAKGGV
jgi:hypothetical protein